MNDAGYSSIQAVPRETSNASEMRSRLGSMRQPQVNDYVKLMRNQPTSDDLTKVCISGELRTSSVRGLVWMMLLKCVPFAKDDWAPVFTRSRNVYTQLKIQHVTDPHMQDSLSLDPCVINPLSDSDHNPWKKFFEDGDLRELISKDVARTFPEMEFFQKDRIRQMLSDILLVYAKENPYISYKQGMHEILAPLLFVLYSDQQTYEHHMENETLNTMDDREREIMAVVRDGRFLEHDSYMLFTEVMRDVCAWYEDGGSPTSESTGMMQQPFMRVQDAPATSRLMDELTAINGRLQEVDPTLYKHLSALDIPPQLYGIRWLRLLFGREFPLHDLLFIWDVLFSQQRPLHKFVHCMAVVMLVHIRTLLLSCDYSGCLQYLMRYPPVADVTTFMRLVLHLRHPTKYARPRQDGASSAHYSHITVSGGAHPARARDSPIVLACEARETASPPPRPAAPTARQPQLMARNGVERRRHEQMASSTRREVDAARSKSGSPLISPPRTNGVSISESERRADQLAEEVRERDERMAECARSLKRLAVELQHAGSASDERRRDVAERLNQIARHLTLPPPPPTDPSRPLPPVRELQELGSNGRAVNGCGVPIGAVRVPANGAVFQLRRRRTSRLISTSSIDSTDSIDRIVASPDARGAPRNYTALKQNRKLQKVTSCPVLFAHRF